jgi:hypothetical protein
MLIQEQAEEAALFGKAVSLQLLSELEAACGVYHEIPTTNPNASEAPGI